MPPTSTPSGVSGLCPEAEVKGHVPVHLPYTAAAGWSGSVTTTPRPSSTESTISSFLPTLQPFLCSTASSLDSTDVDINTIAPTFPFAADESPPRTSIDDPSTTMSPQSSTHQSPAAPRSTTSSATSSVRPFSEAILRMTTTGEYSQYRDLFNCLTHVLRNSDVSFGYPGQHW